MTITLSSSLNDPVIFPKAKNTGSQVFSYTENADGTKKYLLSFCDPYPYQSLNKKMKKEFTSKEDLFSHLHRLAKTEGIIIKKRERRDEQRHDLDNLHRCIQTLANRLNNN